MRVEGPDPARCNCIEGSVLGSPAESAHDIERRSVRPERGVGVEAQVGLDLVGCIRPVNLTGPPLAGVVTENSPATGWVDVELLVTHGD